MDYYFLCKLQAREPKVEEEAAARESSSSNLEQLEEKVMQMQQQEEVEQHFKKNKIDVIEGFGKLKPGKKVEVEGKEYSADHIIIPTGARSREFVLNERERCSSLLL